MGTAGRWPRPLNRGGCLNEFICLQIKVFMLTILVLYLVYIRWEMSSIDMGKGVLIAAV